MNTVLPPSDLTSYVERQLSVFFPDGVLDHSDLRIAVNLGLERTAACFEHVNTKYYRDENGFTKFDHLNSDHYAAFLYFVSNSAYRTSRITVAKKAYLLNKALHSVDIFYEVELPEVFILRHPVGTVLGRATYSNFLFVYQQCLVGMRLGGGTPTFRGPAVLFGGSRIVGNCDIGENCWLSLGTNVLNEKTPPNSIVTGQSPFLSFRGSSVAVEERMFGKSAKDRE